VLCQTKTTAQLMQSVTISLVDIIAHVKVVSTQVTVE
jgi:hypothetical protein